MAQFTSDPSGCALNEQSYPPLLDLSSLGGDRRSTPYESVAQNTVDLNKNIILSGPNRSGKTTVLKTTTLNIIFTQQVGCGFYSSALICPYTHIHSYLNIPDTSGRDSLFQAESRRCKEILDKIVEAKKGAGSRHFCIFDELYSGTNPEEATKAGYAFLKYITGFDNVDFMLTTHYVKICKKFLKSERVENYKMYVRSLGQEGYEYTYKMKPGISKIKGAAQVLKEMDYPEEIINGMK
jgi:DNA mismatch repair protein MutS